MTDSRLILVLACLAILVILVVRFVVGREYPKVIQTVNVTITPIAKSEIDGSFYLKLPVSIDSNISVIPLSREQYNGLVVGDTYNLIIEIWSDGWRPYPKLVSLSLIRVGSNNDCR